MTDLLGAFCPHGSFGLSGAPAGPLAGLRFAAKDLFDVAGHRTGAGNPAWFDSHPPAAANAPVVATLLAAGASLAGKTITDELAYGMTGRNIHYGTPVNSAARDRLPGGSSSGSAAAVAGAVVDFAIGSDTGGSVRIPASYCGIFGIRPSHDRISLVGAVPLAPSFDTVGWFTRDAKLLERVGQVLLAETAAPPRPLRLLRADDLFDLAEPGVAEALAPLIDKVARIVGPPKAVRLAPDGPAGWLETMRLIQAREAWQSDGAWLRRTKPNLAPDVQARFDFAATVNAEMVAGPAARRGEIAARMADLLADNAVMILPTAPGPAPLREATFDELDRVRAQTIPFTCVAGLARLPQVSIPGACLGGAPIGLSLLGAVGSDAMLLRLACDIAA
ncbi:MAG: amidase [Rhodospirillales bacterium]|nr:amidase [Rhodospirillales bacterium]